MLTGAVPDWPLTAVDLQYLLQVAIRIDPYASLDGQLAIHRKVFSLTTLLREKGDLPLLSHEEEILVDTAFEAAELVVGKRAPELFPDLEYAISVIDNLALTIFPNSEILIKVLGLVENDSKIVESLMVGNNDDDIQLNWGTLSTSVLSTYILACARKVCRYGQGMERTWKWGNIDLSFKSMTEGSGDNTWSVEKLQLASFGWVFRMVEVASKLESLFQSDLTMPVIFESAISSSVYQMMVRQTVAKLGLLGPPPVPDEQDLLLTASIMDSYGPATFV